MQDCSWHIIIPDSSVIMQMHSNYKAGNHYLLASLLVSGNALNIDLQVVLETVSCLKGSTLPYCLIRFCNWLLEINLVNTVKAIYLTHWIDITGKLASTITTETVFPLKSFCSSHEVHVSVIGCSPSSRLILKVGPAMPHLQTGTEEGSIT